LVAVIDSYDDATQLCHMRFGHAGEKSMQTLAKQGLLKGAKICKLEFSERCVLGKKTKMKFGTAIHRTKRILTMCIHMFGVPLRMHLLKGNTILSPLQMITLGGIGCTPCRIKAKS